MNGCIILPVVHQPLEKLDVTMDKNYTEQWVLGHSDLGHTFSKNYLVSQCLESVSQSGPAQSNLIYCRRG